MAGSDFCRFVCSFSMMQKNRIKFVLVVVVVAAAALFLFACFKLKHLKQSLRCKSIPFTVCVQNDNEKERAREREREGERKNLLVRFFGPFVGNTLSEVEE